MTRACLIFGLLFSQMASAYPEFIGYKYSSCLTCHYNGNGNGPLNDYGRALWASEISGRFMNKGKTEEQLGAESGFFGGNWLPWWWRPGIKTRDLYLFTNPGRPNEDKRNILMQADINSAFYFDREQKKIFVFTFGYVPEPFRLQNVPGVAEVDTWISREHYFRWQYSEPMWFYIGMMDKVYGIRHVNHTAYSRARVGLAQNDQAHGIIAHYVKPNWEASANIFMGNLYQDAELRQMGLSGMFEYEMKTAWRVGASVLNSSNDFTKNTRVGVHSRYGFGYGAATLFEIGMINNAPEGGTSTSGYYIFSEAIQKINRGYHVYFTGQAYKPDMGSGQADLLKFGVGALMFPMPKLEVRVDVENTRPVENGSNIPKETWGLALQFHVAL